MSWVRISLLIGWPKSVHYYGRGPQKISAYIILRPRVRNSIPIASFWLFSLDTVKFKINLLSVHCERNENKQKMPGVGPRFKKWIALGSSWGTGGLKFTSSHQELNDFKIPKPHLNDINLGPLFSTRFRPFFHSMSRVKSSDRSFVRNCFSNRMISFPGRIQFTSYKSIGSIQ